ncbi:hypothetical protein FXB41_22610 [Bradyrhizobium canariense]|uniref:DUF6932 family protein n=1 Tax=Bradyrhizobium canariense TaxID=255045 RepID=UPI001CA4C867|nr:hypothetical protein [Bradyrhizobium canariense]MBW5437444.1 hypothetical protein [Bradyrhizobium canariense]
MNGPKQAFQPLLPPGRHVIGLDEFKALAVARFSTSVRRPLMFTELERLVADLIALNLTCELWVDGSFLTEKPEPDDIDLTFAAWAQSFDLVHPAVQQVVINSLNGGNKYSPLLHTFICFRFLREDPRRAADKTDYWTEKWGVGWDDHLKGYVVLKLGETDVGLKLFA